MTSDQPSSEPSPGGAARGRGRPSTLDRTAALEAAWRVIAARGLDATRYADVAEESGTPVSTLQNAFGTLQTLLIEAIAHARERDDHFLGTLPTAQDASATDRLDALIRGAVGTGFRADAYLVWLELWRASARDPELAAHSSTTYDRWWSTAESVIAQGQGEGCFTVASTARDLAMATVAILDGVALAMLVPASGRQPETAERVALTGIERLLAP